MTALPIVYYHTSRMFGQSRLSHQSPVAVDFLFLLSGFVMTHAYQQKLDAGWATKELFRTRVLRLYPIYLLGLLAGAAFFLLQARFGNAGVSRSTLFSIFALGLFLCPVPSVPFFESAPQGLYPFNVPAWSLPNQLLANVVHGVCLRRRSTAFLLCFGMALSGLLLMVAISHSTIGLGAERPYYLYGFLRVMFAYPAGMLVYRIWNSGRVTVRLSPLLISGLVLACLYIPTFTRHPGLFEWGEVTFIYPILLLLAANSPATGRMVFAAEWLGSISYPLYMLHVAFFTFFEQAWIHVTRHRIESSAPWGGIACLVLLMAVSHWLAMHYDPEARKWIGDWIQPVPKPMLAEAATKTA